MSTRYLLLLAISAALAAAQPVILAEKDGGGVFNAASLIYSELPGGGIAQGGYFVVKGRNFGVCQTTVMSSFPLPLQLSGVSIDITVGGVTSKGIMYYVVTCLPGNLPDQVSAILPSSTPVGNGNLTVTVNGQTSAPYPVTVFKSAPGIFTRAATGAGPAWVYNAVTYSQTMPSSPSRPGDAMGLMATGLGPVTHDETRASPVVLTNLVPDLEVWVGGKKAQMLYNNRLSGCCSGVDQVNFVVPAGVEGCYVPLVLKSGSKISNYSTMAIAAQGNACSDSVGLSASDLQGWTGKTSVTVGGVGLSRTAVHANLPPGTLPPGFSLDFTTDAGVGTFYRFDPSTLANISNPFNSANFGQCKVTFFGGGAAEPSTTPSFAFLDAGPAISVTGPKGQKSLTKGAGAPNLYYGELGGGANPLGSPPLFLDAGNYTVAGPGGVDIGSFSVAMTIPAPLNWTNRDSIVDVPRSQDLLVTWTGGDPAGFVTITGLSSAGNSGAMFTCTERVSAGQFSVPSIVLSALPVSPINEGIPSGSLSVIADTQWKRFTASGCDLCTLSHGAGDTSLVNYK